jgi:hypothetical protein
VIAQLAGVGRVAEYVGVLRLVGHQTGRSLAVGIDDGRASVRLESGGMSLGIAE